VKIFICEEKELLHPKSDRFMKIFDWIDTPPSCNVKIDIREWFESYQASYQISPDIEYNYGVKWYLIMPDNVATLFKLTWC
jgi:hypothetical protein